LSLKAGHPETKFHLPTLDFQGRVLFVSGKVSFLVGDPRSEVNAALPHRRVRGLDLLYSVRNGHAFELESRKNFSLENSKILKTYTLENEYF